MSSQSTPKQPALPLSLKPIEILQSPNSQFYANLHPVLLLSILFFSFKSLVNDPVNTLIGLAPTVTILQGTYCILCLPSTGQTSATLKPGQQKKKASAASKQSLQDFSARLVPTFLSLLLTLTLSAPLLYILVVLFGAPITTHLPHTLLLALHLSLLTTPHLYYAHGLVKETWFKIASLQIPIDELFGMTLGACMGAWIGAIPIPLDWDREWQKWPVTIVVGMYLGAVVGKLAGGFVFRGWQMTIS